MGGIILDRLVGNVVTTGKLFICNEVCCKKGSDIND